MMVTKAELQQTIADQKKRIKELERTTFRGGAIWMVDTARMLLDAAEILVENTIPNNEDGGGE